jgi:2-dehydro-3-deoxygluconokinase
MMQIDRPGPILCFGELLLRLDAPPGTRLGSASSFAAQLGGAEANVAAMLSQLGRRTELLSVLSDSSLGEYCLVQLGAAGVGTKWLQRREGRLGIYFLEHGAAGRASRIVYDRERSAFALHPGGFDWSNLAAEASWFHLSGITLAVSDAALHESLDAVAAMRVAGVPLSFDANHRASLWAGREEQAAQGLNRIAEQADVLFASPFDIGRALGRMLPDATAQDRRAAAELAFERYPHLQVVASTRRQISGAGQQLAARVDYRGEGFETEAAALGPIVDRIGSGDAFAGAVVDALLRGLGSEGAARFGLAAAVLKHGIRGDRFVGCRDELDACAAGTVMDVQR